MSAAILTTSFFIENAVKCYQEFPTFEAWEEFVKKKSLNSSAEI
jgi:hypothetical protein